MSDLICLGKIVAAHGIKGEVKVKSFTSNPKDVCAYGKLSNKDKTRFFDLTFKGFAKELLRVKIKDIDTRNDSESLIGTELFISRDRLPDLEKDTFYLTDLEGLKVLDNKTDTQIGKIVGVYNFGAGDILEIKFDDAKQTEMLPFNDAYVPLVDVKNGFIKVTSKTMTYQQEADDAQS
ncbi:MAG: 16S rRNA processing protein RimM [Elusimicrobiaceae bacterium]|jgi:16S rRNA processing protein RimM|nr:16S rRNA processing protein RimM [Elusimicrobiaceae bacterium]MBR1916073.1 16S rRNA processing protein RimM [Alphaproteobacteria bacterium]